MHFTVCFQVVNHNNERERTEFRALGHAAVGCLPRGNAATYSYSLTSVTEIWYKLFKQQWLLLKLLSLVNRMLWLTMLKAFLKSANNTRTEPLLSRVGSHLCWIAIKACVVDLPGRQPYWFSSRNRPKDGISQSLTMSSRTLATVRRREIGRRSFWLEAGGWILGNGTTSADFQIGGTNPSLIEELKMAASG